MLEVIVLVGLTMAAWKRGWKKWALVPALAYLPLCFIAGFFLGSMAGLNGSGDFDSMATVTVLGILIAICVTLIVMIITGHKRHDAKTILTPPGNTSSNSVTLR